MLRLIKPRAISPGATVGIAAPGGPIDAERLAQIRETRRPGSPYASLKQCYWEVDAAESLLRRSGVPVFNTTHSSIEEIASRVLQQLGLQREMF